MELRSCSFHLELDFVFLLGIITRIESVGAGADSEGDGTCATSTSKGFPKRQESLPPLRGVPHQTICSIGEPSASKLKPSLEAVEKVCVHDWWTDRRWDTTAPMPSQRMIWSLLPSIGERHACSVIF